MGRDQVAGFMVAAVLVRCMDAGATVGLVLLCSASDLTSPLRTAGLLGAALTAPHALGFLSAPLLDRAADPRRVVAVASTLFAALLATVASGVDTMPLPVVLLLALGAGAAGPMLTGGLSSLVEGGAADDRTRRLRAVDALTYGIAGAAAPVVVSVVAVVVTPRVALLALSALGLAGAVLVLRLPGVRSAPAQVDSSRAGARGGLAAVLRHAPLRRVALLTWLGALLVAAALLAGMSLGEEHARGRGGWVAAVFGLGSLAGGLALTVHPPRMSPDRGMVLLVGLLAPPLVTVALVGDWFPALLAVYAALGLVVAAQTVLSLAARGEYAPPGTHGSVFVTVAGTKVAFASAGTALAGLAGDSGSRWTLVAAATVALVVSLTAQAASRTRLPRELPDGHLARGCGHLDSGTTPRS